MNKGQKRVVDGSTFQLRFILQSVSSVLVGYAFPNYVPFIIMGKAMHCMIINYFLSFFKPT